MESNWRFNVAKWGMYPIEWLGIYWYVVLCAEGEIPLTTLRLKIHRGGPMFRLDCVWSVLEQLYVPSGNFFAVGPNERFPYNPDNWLPDH